MKPYQISHPLRVVFLGTAVAAAALCGACSSSSSSSTTKPAPAAVAPQRSFDSADQAVDALVAAVRTSDAAQLEQILGPDARETISSGDPVADRNSIDRFLAAYNEKHALVPAPDTGGDVMTLQVGNTDWPMPIPVVKGGDGRWTFDVEAGRDEMLNRRIGDNELSAQQVCLAVVDAQREYAANDNDGDGLRPYATKFLSDVGLQNGLYWQTPAGAPPSPLGGYLYRVLTAQGPAAPGGAMNYVVNGKLLGGFGVVAYPAQYGNSGIMSFITNHDGVLYEKDLGPQTSQVAAAMKAFDPGDGWKRVDVVDERR
jgi:hypothetical protein